MSMSVRYWGEFRSIRGDLYRVEILREDNGITTPAEQIGFAYDEPAEIEWSDVEKLDPVQGSSLTLTLDSDSDRKFLALYTIDINTIRADVYRNGALYWSGMLDPELYEEPYSYKQDYDVSISFSDFAILDRKPWEGREILSVRAIIDKCLAATAINYAGLISHISTSLPATTAPLSLEEIYITSDNFFDEENEPMTMREVLEAVLQPYALQISQKNGQIYLRDLNALHALDAQPVVWSDTDAALEADKVYNNVKVTFSPYSADTLIDGTIEHEDALKNRPIGSSGTLIRVTNRDADPEGFRIVVASLSDMTGEYESLQIGNIRIGGGARLCRFDAEYSGEDAAAVRRGYRPTGDTWNLHPPVYEGYAPPYQGGSDTRPASHPALICTDRRQLRAVANPNRYKLKISLDTLFDVRYNPFEGAEVKNEEGNWDRLENRCNYGYVPVGIYLYDNDGKCSYYYDNEGCTVNDTTHKVLGITYGSIGETGRWVKASGRTEPPYVMSWLSYYASSSRKNKTGFGGWATNRTSVSPPCDRNPSAVSKLGSGMYIDLPPVSGWLVVEVYQGILTIDHSRDDGVRNITPFVRWVAYKDIKVDIVKANGRDLDKEDVEDTAWINKSAKEDLSIDTTIGTMAEPVPSAQGLLLDVAGTVISTFSRAGHTDRLERLLIGTAYSQYATRKHVLSGTVELLPEFGVLTDKSEPGQYVLLSEVQHLMRGESEIRMVQFNKDEYDNIEDKND